MYYPTEEEEFELMYGDDLEAMEEMESKVINIKFNTFR